MNRKEFLTRVKELMPTIAPDISSFDFDVVDYDDLNQEIICMLNLGDTIEEVRVKADNKVKHLYRLHLQYSFLCSENSENKNN